MKNNSTLFDFLCSNSLRRFANKNSFAEKNTITVKNIHKQWLLMPLMVLTILFTKGNAWGQSAGFNNTFIILSLNGGSNTYYDMNAATANTDFNGANLGTFAAGSSNLTLKGAEHNVYKCGGCDLTSTRLYYRIYSGAASGSYISNSIGYTSGANNGCGGQDQTWSSTALTTNLLSGLSAGTYTIEAYSDATVTCSGGTVYASNSGNNYKATFTVVSTFYSKSAQTDPNSLSNWTSGSGGTGINPPNFTNDNYTFVLQSGHSYTTTAAWNITGASTLQVDGTLTLSHVLTNGTVTTKIGNLTVNGTVQANTQNVIANTSGSFTINSGGRYVMNNTTANVNTTTFNGVETFNTGSTFEYAALPSVGLTSGLTFHHYTISGNITATFPATITINGDFTVSGASAVITINKDQTVGGNMVVSAGTVNVNTGATGRTLTITGNLTVSGGTLNISNASDAAQVDAISVGGNTTISSGTLDINAAGASSTNAGRLFVKGNLTVSGTGTLKSTRTLTTGSGGVYFDGTSVAQSFTHSGGTLSTASGGIGRRFYYKTSSGPTISETYSSSTAQTTVDGTQGSPTTGYAAWPTTASSTSTFTNLTINNTAGVTLSQSKTITGTLTLTAGILTTTSSNLLSLTSTATGSISGGGTTTFISGPVQRSIGTGTYAFPVGKSSTYYPYTIVTSASSSPVVTVEAFAANAGGSLGSQVSALSTTEYWSATLNSGTLTGAVSLTRQAALSGLDVIAQSSTLTGGYSSIGGAVSGTSINTSNSISSLGFFLMATGAVCADPTNQASGISFTGVGATSMTVNWSGSGNGDGVIVVMKAGSAPTDPSDNTAYTASTTFGSGTDIGSSSFVVLNGSGSSVTVTGLSASTTYHVKVYSKNCSGSSTKINTTSPPSSSQISLATELAAHPASFTSAATLGGQIDLTYSDANTITNAAGYIILQKSGASAPASTPTDATSYSIGGTIGDGTVADIVTDITQTTSAITSLSSSTQYSYSIIPFSYDGSNSGTYNYYTAATIKTTTATTIAAVTRYAVANGNWNATTTWSATSGGSPGSSVPTGSDLVYIQGGFTVTVTADATSGAIYFNDASGTLSINSGVTLAGGAINVVQGDKTVSGTIAGAGTLTCTTVNIGTGAPSLNATRTTTLTSTINTLTATGSTTLTARDNGGFRNNPTFNLQNGTFTTTGITTSNQTSSCTSTFTMATGTQTGTLKLTGATPFTISGNATSTITLNGTSATVEYSGTAQTVRNTSYTNLTLSGSGNKTLAAFSVSGKLSLQGTAAAITTAPSSIGTLEYKGSSSQTTTAIEWPSSGVTNVIIDNSAGVTMGSGLSRTISGSLTLTSGTLTTAANTLTYSGSSVSRTTGNIDSSNASGVVAFTNTTGITLPASLFSGTVSTFTVNGSGGLTLGGNTTIGTLNLTSGILTVGSANTVTINSGGSVARTSGALASGTGAGKFSFSGTGTVTGTVGFNDVDISGGVNFGTASTINGTLTINSGGFAQTNTLTYGSSSTLTYNTTGSYGIGNEWTGNSTTAGSGIPNNVTIQNSTTLTFPTTNRGCAGNFNISSGGATLNVTSGDLYVAGNFTNNGTFTHNTRALFLNGGASQTLNGTLNGTSTTNCFPYLIVNKSANGVTLNTPVNVTNTLTLTAGVIATSTSNILHITNTSAAAMSGGNSTSYVSGPLRWSVSNGSGGDYKFHVGKSSTYLPLNVNNPTGTSPVITAEAFVANAGGTAGSGLASLSTSEYWSVVNTGTLSAATISLAKASIGSNDGIGTSTSLAGSYTNLGGSVTNTLIASNTVTAGTTVGSLATTTYFVLGVKVAAPTITASGGVVASSPGSGTSGYVGNTVTINGTGLGSVTVVKVGGSGGTSVTITGQTATTLTFTAINAGGTIYVENPGGNATSTESYTNLGYISNAASDWNTTTTWLGSAVPVASSTVTINHAVTVNSTATNVPSSVTINSTKSLTFGASGALTATTVTNNGSIVMTDGGILNIATGGTLANGSNTFTRGAGTVAFAGTGSVTGTIGFNNVTLAGGVNFGTTSTINGTLTINGGGFVNTNAPTYANTSTLLYNTTGTYGRGSEWSATSGAGYPNNVQISNSTTLNLGANSGTGTARQLAGNLTVDALSSLTMNASGEAMTASLTVKGNYINNGTTTLSSSIGGDLALEGNLTDNNVFTANGRAIFFRGGNTQSITSNSNPLDIDVVRMEKTGGEVLLLQNLLVDETADPIKFEGTSSTLNLNGYTATFGKAGTASTITMNSTSAIKGSSTSSLIILGTGAAGTIRFDQTTPGTTNVLQNLTINRTSTGTVTLGNALTVAGNLTLTDGTLTVGGNTLTYAGSSIDRTSGAIDASNANATLALTNTSALTLPASLFSGNVNNLTMNGAGGVTLGSATTVAGVLNLSSGDIITSSTNTLTLSSTASITNGGSSSYIEGPLDRTLANGSSFSYPIGGNSTNYRPLNLNSVVATGNPVVRVTVAETGATTVDGTTLESLLNSRNWRVEQISGTFTSATLVITESSITNGTHEIGKSNNNQAGTYVSLGSQTVSAGAITSPAGQGVGFYAIGVKASCTNPTAGGTIAETQTICSGGDPATFTSSVAASGNIGTLEYKWQYSSTSDFSSDINDIASSNAETYDAPSGLTATRYYRRLARVSCKADWTGAAESNILMVTVRSAFTTGEISSTGQTICSGGTPTEIGSTTAASGGDGSITYSWRSSSDSYSAAIEGATSATYTPPSGLTVTTSYRRYANDGTCNTTATVSTGTWTVTVYDTFTSGAIETTGETICNGGDPVTIGSDTDASGGDASITYSWRSSSDSYSAAIDGATSSTYTPPSGLTATTSYRRYANDGTCNTTATVSTGTWTVTVYDTFTSGAIETTGETICNGGDPVTIGSDTEASGGDDSITYKWKANGVDIASTNSATYNPPSGLTTTTTYTRYAKDATCNTTFELSSGSYVVTVTATPASAGNYGSILLCAGITLTETLLYNALTGSPAAGGTWSPTIPTSGSVAGTYTYTQESSPCAVNTATVTVTDSEIVTWNGSWSPSAPTASTSAVIQSAYQTSEDINACSLRVTGGATVVILSGAVTLNGPIIAESSNSFVTFNNNAILLQNGSGYVNTGNINYKKASSPIFRLDYTLWSSPLTAASQPIFDFSPQTLTNRFYTYNESTNFYTTNDMYSSGTPALSASSSFKVGRGYLIRSPNNWVSSPSSATAWTGTFTGVPNNGDISVAINYSGENKGYNAVGNPYPSPISITSFLSDNSGVIGSTLWFWRKTNGVSGSAYVTYSAGTFSSGSHSVFNIQPGQGFFVRATSSGSLQFKNSQRVGTNGSFFRNNSQTTATGEGRLWLNLKSNAIVVGNMALGYKEGATNDLDLVYDGEYLNDSSLALTSSLPGKELSVQHRAAPFVDTDVVPLSFKTDVAGTYSIDFNGTDGVLDTQDIYLEDLLLGQSVDIKTTPYTFASAAGTFTDRFRIVYVNNALGTDGPIFNANQVIIYKNEINDFVINSGNVIMSNIKVYDVRGRLLQEYKNVNDFQTTINVGLVNQVLLVQITSEDGVMVTKKVIR